MHQSRRLRANWLIFSLLASVAALLWEIGADAGRVRVVVRFLAGQRVSLGSASASDSFVLLSYLAEMFLLGAVLVLFLAWRRRTRGQGQVLSSLIVVWWMLWVGANIVGRIVELTYRATSSLTDIRNVTLIDAADCVALGVSLLLMVVAVRRAEQRSSAQRAVATIATAATRRTTKLATAKPAVTAVPEATARSRTQVSAIAVAVAALVVAPLALGFVVSNGTLAATKAPAAQVAAAAAWHASNATSTACPDALFQPSGPLAAGVTSTCGNVSLGSSLLSADCTKGAIPSGLSPEVFDNAGHESNLGTVAAVAGGCALTTKSTTVTAAVLAGDAAGPVDEPGAVVVVADFLPSTNASGVNTVGVRVSSSSEFDVALQSGGEYAVIESSNGATPEALLQGTFRAGQRGAPDLTKAVRVVVAIKGVTASAYVDGVLLGTGPTSVPNAPGGCGFSVSTNDASHPVVATMVRMEIFAAG